MNVKTAKELRAMNLEDLSEEMYYHLDEQGILHVYFPEASGIYEDDMSRIDRIGQNGGDGEHYTATFKGVVVDNTGWPHSEEDGYAEKIEKLYGCPKDDMFVDDYDPDGSNSGAYKPCSDTVERPNHYMLGNLDIEAIDVIEAVLQSQEALDWMSPQEGYCYGNVLKYLLRAPQKNELEDIKKAQVYFNWLVTSLEGDIE